MCWEASLNILEGRAMGAAVLVSREDDRRASSTPSRYIFSLLGGFRDLRFVKEGPVLAMRPWLMLMADAAITLTKADRFIVVFNRIIIHFALMINLIFRK